MAENRPTGTRGASAAGDVRQLLSDTLQQWLLALGTQNTKRARFDDEFVLYVDDAKFAATTHQSGSTRTRIVLAFHAALLEVSLVRGGNHPGWLLFDAPKQHELSQTDFDAYAERLREVLKRHFLNWDDLQAKHQERQFLDALNEDFQFRHEVARATSYQSEEAKKLAGLATDMLRAVPARRWMIPLRSNLIDRLGKDPETAPLKKILDALNDNPHAASWQSVQDRLADAFAVEPNLSSVLWKTMEWPYPFALVLREELKQIEVRRAPGETGLAAESIDVSDLAAQMELVGLAFSGGGIRSATFCVGVLQKLAEFGLLTKIDYLSTVSGGGYAGAWLAGWIKRRQLDQVRKSLSPEASPNPRDSSQKPIQFLKEFSNYLTPKLGAFSFDTWTMFAVYTRNVMLNQATLFALLGALLLVPRFLALPMMPEVAKKEGKDLWMVILASTMLVISVACMSLNMSRATEAADRENQDPNTVDNHAQQPIDPNATESADRENQDPNRVDNHAQQPIDPNGFYGTVRVQIYVVGSMLMAVFFGSLWFWENIGDADHPLAQWWKWWPWAFLLLMVLSLLLAIVGGFWRCFASHLQRNAKRNIWPKLLITALITASCAGVSLGMLRLYLEIMLRLRAYGDVGAWSAEIWGPVMLLTVLVVPGILQIGLMGVDFPDSGREWMSRFRAVCSIYVIYWVALLGAVIYGPLLVLKAALSAKFWLSGLIVTWIATTVSSFLVGRSRKTGRDKEGRPTISKLEMLATVGPPVFIAGLVILIATLEQLILAYNSNSAVPYDLVHLSRDYWKLLDPWPLSSGNNWFLVEAFVSLAGAALILAWRVDINEFSMHHFYKNRLVRCYLGASHENRNPNPFTGFDDGDDFPLSSLRATHKDPYFGPYPIINATLNLSAGKQLAWQERKAASFIFTSCFCGFDFWVDPEKGRPPADIARLAKLRDCAYRETVGYAQRNGPHCGTTVSISGAAANPNQGYNTSPAVAFLMTIFNVRLGWWMGNPRRDRESKLSSPRFGLAALVSEMLGRTDDQGNFVNLSDGGHFDNMGIYELVRRRCRFIILCDAEQDAYYRFSGLGMAIRKCRADFGAQIDIDTARIAPTPGTHVSESHCAVGSIKYLDGSRGTLLYIKASLTGDESKDVIEYHANQPHFPHESTADQWFTESRFESYRALGFHATERSLTPSDSWQLSKPEMPLAVKQLFSALEKYWYPENPHLRDGASKHTATLAERLHMIQQNPGLHKLGVELFPNSGITPKGKRNQVEEFYFCMSIIQLVEDLYFEFELDRKKWLEDPRIGGWRYLFSTWKNVPMVASTWAAEGDTFREDFQHFWNTMI